MRLFACSLLDAADRASYDEWVCRLIEAYPRLLRPIPPNSAHITYAFIGRLDAAMVPRAIEALRAVAGATEPIALTLGPPTVLSAGRDARLIHAAVVEGTERLSELTVLVARRLEDALPGVAVDASRSPHLTLARFKRGTTRRAAEPVTRTLLEGSVDPRRRHVAQLHLVSSELTTGQPIYAVLGALPLRRGGVLPAE